MRGTTPGAFKTHAKAPFFFFALSLSSRARARGFFALPSPSRLLTPLPPSPLPSLSPHSLCLEANEAQGIALPEPDQSCGQSCGKSITGLPGRPVAAGTAADPGYACLSLPSELGDLNRFGHVHGADGLCRTAIGDVATATDSYTCFCVFQKTSAGPAPSA